MKTAKRLCAALLALALIFTLAGCNAQTTEPTPTPTPKPAAGGYILPDGFTEQVIYGADLAVVQILGHILLQNFSFAAHMEGEFRRVPLGSHRYLGAGVLDRQGDAPFSQIRGKIQDIQAMIQIAPGK